MDVSTLTNEELLSEYDASVCCYMTRDPEPLRAEILRRMGLKADPTADTLRPDAPDAFSQELIDRDVRARMQTVDDSLEERDRQRNRELGRLVGKERGEVER